MKIQTQVNHIYRLKNEKIIFKSALRDYLPKILQDFTNSFHILGTLLHPKLVKMPKLQKQAQAQKRQNFPK